jgi:zinc transport system substrate-binding protein
MDRKCRIFASLAVIQILCAGCRDSKDNQTVQTKRTEGKPTVCAVNYPLAFFARRIAGDNVEVKFPIPDDVDPAFWRPSADEISEFQSSDLVLLNGANYAKWLSVATLSESKLVNTTVSVREQLIRVKETVTHRHGPEGQHSHAGIAFTTWLDPEIAIIQADAIRAALVRTLPEQKAVFNANFDELQMELRKLDEQVADILRRKPDMPIVFSHPVYQYFSRKYKLNSKSVHWEPDTIPDDTQWSALENLLETHDAKVMIWESEPLPETADRLRELDVESIVFDPCGNEPQHGDFLTVMSHNLTQLRKID